MNIVGPVEVSGPEVVDRIGRFRYEVWLATGLIDPAGFPGQMWRDPLDDVARHWIVEVDGRLAASVRYAQFDRLEDMPEYPQYQKLGVELEGPIGLPERLCIAKEFHGLGLLPRLYEVVGAAVRAAGARWTVSEASPGMLPYLLARGRKHLGPGAYDPRFPKVQFQLMLGEAGRHF